MLAASMAIEARGIQVISSLRACGAGVAIHASLWIASELDAPRNDEEEVAAIMLKSKHDP